MNHWNRSLHLVLAVSILSGSALALAGCAGSKSRLKVGQTVDGEVVEAEGLAAVTDDLIGVKRAALADAYKNAIEKVVGIFISAQTMVDKAVTIQQNILGKTNGYIKKHEVLKEGVEADGLYHAHIRALVSFQQIQNDLRDLELIKPATFGNPRVAILLDETADASGQQTTACSDALAQALIERGYQVVDRSELAAIRVAEATQDLLAGKTEQALKPIVQRLNAEVVITGKASSQLLTTEGLGGLISYRGTLNAKALRAQGGEVLGTIATQGSGLDATRDAAAQKSLANLGKSAGNELGARIAQELSKRSIAVVHVRGLDDLNQLSEIKRLLAHTAGVGDLQLRSFFDRSAEIEVRLNTATSSDLANALSRNKAVPLQILSQTQDYVEAQLAQKP